ncbi:MAG: anti-sigma regulatory factor [Pseudomonadota bacterium]|nr:anti-sigma regulatory factor [Pseudomonadota bacterium]
MFPAPALAELIHTALRERYRSVRKDSLIVPLRTDEDVVHLRRHVRERALAIKLSLIDQTKVVTAASELARNTIKYGGGGEVQLELLHDGVREGLALLFVDGGPGIADVELALTDGYTSGGGLGLGLSGSRRLMDEFEIDTRVGEGMAVSVAKWKR